MPEWRKDLILNPTPPDLAAAEPKETVMVYDASLNKKVNEVERYV
ncbi:MAG: hypothetical protein ACOY30_11480 [Bacillota bacterium]